MHLHFLGMALSKVLHLKRQMEEGHTEARINPTVTTILSSTRHRTCSPYSHRMEVKRNNTNVDKDLKQGKEMHYLQLSNIKLQVNLSTMFKKM